MNKFKYTLKHCDGQARLGEILTAHGKINTPAFMPVGTRATIKTATPDEVKNTGAEIILGNTYHLFLKPGDKLIRDLGGLHSFMAWNGPILTDSGGYQVFSLGENKKGESLVKIKGDSVEFKSHIDGKKHIFTPKKVIDIQLNLGSDIMMPLDVCPSANAPKKEIEAAVELTGRWFEEAYHHYLGLKGKKGALFAIIQGGTYRDLREKSYHTVSRFDVDGFSIGGVANAGESKEKQRKALEATLPLLPSEKPRYLMGVGDPIDILEAVEQGVDMFDCVLPTRIARNGTVLTFSGKMNLNNAGYAKDKSPIEESCDCEACEYYSRAYIRHLLNVGEILGIRLTTIHNLRFMQRHMANIREAIAKDNFAFYKSDFIKNGCGPRTGISTSR